ncbi:hypothetical protein KDH_00800 [Dictyobacter sp. S3.2.2.5]|uniref:histidine kinase n=1 Tax=Dictyobacter halimunensis TaxID=3026934 RepID=A0ABQ6FGX9_9CHLR|nr:hypothetical protein KDH_00800 [Dictyobacter sp. S3.2.2.5]
MAQTVHQQAYLTLIADQLLPSIWRQKHAFSPDVRIWSLGCQAGDEALRLLLHLIQQQQVPTDTTSCTIFATDPDVEAVTRARKLATTSHLDQEPSLAAYQSLLQENWEGRSLPKVWRQSLIFGAHNVLTEVPFPRLDLIIVHLPLSSYGETHQANILNRLAYALRPQGYLLFLGEQEGVSPDAALFQRHESSPVPCYQRTATPVQFSALALARQQGYQLPAAALDTHPDQDRDALIEELQVMLEEQTVLIGELEAQARLNQDARLAQLHLAAIVASSEVAIVSIDLQGLVTSWNAGAEHLYGSRAQEMVGQSVECLFSSDHQENIIPMMERIRRGEYVPPYETRQVHQDGRLVSVSVTISPVKEWDGTIVGASIIAHDLTARRELDQQREAFMNLVTHELKHPLTALSGNIQLAHRWLTRLLARPEHLDDEQHHVLEAVLTMLGRSQQQMRTQQRLIDDLLDLSHLQQGTLALRQESCHLCSLVYETVQNYQAAYPSRLIELTLPEQDDILVSGDRDRLGQVLSNYLSNALKFAPSERPVHVGLCLQAETVRVWVRDEGPGLSPEHQAQIWDQYSQLSETPVQHGWKAGLGLGLYICRQFIHQQHGEVGVESTPGQGATFWFSLPSARRAG